MSLHQSLASPLAQALSEPLTSGGRSQLLTLGKTTPGDQPATSASANYVWASGPYEAESSGTIESISIYVSQATGSVTLGVWKDNAGAIGDLVAVSAEAFPVENEWVAALAAGPIVAGEKYWVGWNFSANRLMTFDLGPAGSTKYKASAYSSGALPDPFPASPSLIGRHYPVYFTYKT